MIKKIILFIKSLFTQKTKKNLPIFISRTSGDSNSSGKRGENLIKETSE
jgi:hypothetical protein